MEKSYIAKLWEKKIIEELQRKPLFERVFIVKYSEFKIVRWAYRKLKIGKWEFIDKDTSIDCKTIKINKIKYEDLN